MGEDGAVRNIIVSYSRGALISEAISAHANEEEIEAIENLNYNDQYVINGTRFILIKDKDDPWNNS